MMRSLLLFLVLLLSSSSTVDAFTFMKGWKLPGRNRGARIAKQTFGDKKLAVITGASTPLGQQTIQDLLQTGDYHVIGAYASQKDVDNAAAAKAATDASSSSAFTPMLCDDTSLDSVRDFCNKVHVFRGSKTLDKLVCLAGLCDENENDASTTSSSSSKSKALTFTPDFLANYLMTAQLLNGMVDSKLSPQVTMMSSSSSGSSSSSSSSSSSTLLAQQLVTNYLHTKYNKLTGVSFNTLALPASTSSNTKKLTSVAKLLTNAKLGKQSGVNFVYNDVTNQIQPQELVIDNNNNNNNNKAAMYDIDAAYQLVQACNALVDAQLPAIKQVTSPCPTLMVIGAITKQQVQREELKRMKQGRPGISEPMPVENLKAQLTKRQRVLVVVDKVVTTVLKQTIGRVARLAGRNVLGEIPDEALSGSYDQVIVAESNPTSLVVKVEEAAIDELQAEITNQLAQENQKRDDHKNALANKKLVVLTGTSSGLGRKAALALLRTGDYHVIGAVRDLDKMQAVAEVDGFDLDNFTPMYCEMNSFDSVRQFCKNVNAFRGNKPLDRLVCNAGIYQPSLPYAKWSADGHEQTMQTNFLSHFLMISELIPAMKGSNDPRVTMVGSVTGNDNTVGGGGVYPIADLHDLDGFKAGFNRPIEMADGYGFDGAKAYKDSKLCLMMLANFLHTKYHKTTGIAFSSMYPGCIAESPLFREKRAWFRQYFPIFMKFITGGFVGEHEAGQRLFQVVHDPRCSKSGVYWSWNGGPREDRGLEAIEKGGQISGGGGAGGGWDSIFENDQSSKVLNIETVYQLFTTATEITGAKWPYENESRIEIVKPAGKTIEVVPGSTLGGASSITNMTASTQA